ncbi:MAG TPA: CBS domain-containing protein [Actinomycetota bacterium]|jgi:CBS domain-containing protein
MAILVRHAMTESPKTVGVDASISEVAKVMKSEDVGVVPVLAGEEPVGLITDRDLVIRVLADGKDPGDLRAGDIATRAPLSVTPDMRLSEARELMEEHQVRRLPVVKGRRLVGILSLGDVAWADASTRKVGEALRAVSESESTVSSNEGPTRGTPDRTRRSH